jgi:hypothetical protein
MEKKEHHSGKAMQIMKHGMLCKQYTHLPEVCRTTKITRPSGAVLCTENKEKTPA